MSDRRILMIGLAGTALTGLCCFTPLLGLVPGVAGLSAVLGWADMILLPLLAAFVALSVHALTRRGA